MNSQCVNGMVHVIQPGENLYQLSRKYRVPLALILRANPYVDVYNLQPGQEICIPMSRPIFPVPPVPPVAPVPPVSPAKREQEETELEEKEVEAEEDVLYVADGTKSVQKIWEEMGVTMEEFARQNDWNEIIVAADVTLHVPKKV